MERVGLSLFKYIMHLYEQYGINKRQVRVMAAGEYNIFQCPEVHNTLQLVGSLTTQRGLLVTGRRSMICSVQSVLVLILGPRGHAQPGLPSPDPQTLSSEGPSCVLGYLCPWKLLSPFCFLFLRHIAAGGSKTRKQRCEGQGWGVSVLVLYQWGICRLQTSPIPQLRVFSDPSLPHSASNDCKSCSASYTLSHFALLTNRLRSLSA